MDRSHRPATRERKTVTGRVVALPKRAICGTRLRLMRQDGAVLKAGESVVGGESSAVVDLVMGRRVLHESLGLWWAWRRCHRLDGCRL